MVPVFIVSLISSATPAVNAYRYTVRIGAEDEGQARVYAYAIAMAFLRDRRGDPVGLRVTRVARDDRLRTGDGRILEFRAVTA